METLNRILAPLHEQTERTRRSLKRTGRIPEVDSATGHDCPNHGVRTFATASLVALFIPHLLDGPLLQLHCVIEHVLW